MLIMQTWFSPSFPIGAFSYSHGLEAAIQEELIDDAETLGDWISYLLTHGTGFNDSLLLKGAYEDVDDVNRLCLCLAASKERQQESIEMGYAFSRAVGDAYGVSLPQGLGYPIAVGSAARMMELDLQLTIQSYLQAFAANLISVGVRTIPIGQQGGLRCLAGLSTLIQSEAAKSCQEGLEMLGSSVFTADLMSMRHENSSPRVYRT